jgi:hypothetical protein
MFGESFVVDSRRVRSAMCGGSITGAHQKTVFIELGIEKIRYLPITTAKEAGF